MFSTFLNYFSFKFFKTLFSTYSALLPYTGIKKKSFIIRFWRKSLKFSCQDAQNDQGFLTTTLKTPYRCGSDIWVVARLWCRSQYDTKRIVVASIRVAIWQRYTYKTRYRYQSDTYRYNRFTMYKDLNCNN